MAAYCQSLIQFSINHPALFHGLAFLLGIGCSLNGFFFHMIPCLTLCLPFLAIAVRSKDVLKL